MLVFISVAKSYGCSQEDNRERPPPFWRLCMLTQLWFRRRPSVRQVIEPSNGQASSFSDSAR